jgi:sulfate transport system ATP-binding protein
VALARALAVKPKVLLLDEPFGALDAKVRKELRRWLRRLHEEVHVTSVFVTHDQEEALEVSDRVVIMNEGRVEQSGTPEEVYDRPATPFVYGFLGDVNLFHGRIHQGRVNIGEGELEAPEWADARDQDGVAYVRTYDVELHPSSNGAGSLEAVVRHIRAFGPVVRIELDLLEDGRMIEAHVTRSQFARLQISKGDRVYVSPTNAKVFAKEG